jgi:hypothetical protein
MYVLLSFLTLCLTSLWALLCSVWAVAFSFLVLLLLIAPFLKNTNEVKEGIHHEKSKGKMQCQLSEI